MQQKRIFNVVRRLTRRKNPLFANRSRDPWSENRSAIAAILAIWGENLCDSKSNTNRTIGSFSALVPFRGPDHWSAKGKRPAILRRSVVGDIIRGNAVFQIQDYELIMAHLEQDQVPLHSFGMPWRMGKNKCRKSKVALGQKVARILMQWWATLPIWQATCNVLSTENEQLCLLVV